MFPLNQKCEQNWQISFAILSMVLLAIRLISISFSALQLGPDEAQYWRWSTSFDWGYYSKPPMIAWVIGLSTTVFGHSEWAIRILSPFFHLATGIFLFLLGKQLWSAKAGTLAGLTYLLMPGVWLSATIISTDAILLTFWSASLYVFFRLRETPKLWLGATLGVAIGLGFLSKYAMIYFLLGTGLAILWDTPTRRALFSPAGGLTCLSALLVLAPHIIWSIANGFKTIGHTADNANWGENQQLFNPDQMVKFFIDQFGVFGPGSYALLLAFVIACAFGMTRLRTQTNIRILLGFSVPPLAIILGQAFISRAHANWAATAYPAAALILSAWAVYATRFIRPVLYTGFALNLLIGGLFTFVIMAPAETANQMGAANAMKRLRGWPETVTQVRTAAEQINASSIIVDEREIWHGLDYYGRDGLITAPVRAWRRNPVAGSFSEEAPLTEADTANALVLSFRPGDLDRMAADFGVFEPVGEIEIDLGGNRYRRLRLFQASEFSPRYRPLETEQN